jgi:hypothetical protein
MIITKDDELLEGSDEHPLFVKLEFTSVAFISSLREAKEFLFESLRQTNFEGLI